MPRKPDSLDNFRQWFDAYTSRFLGADALVDAHVRMKQEHTRRTCAEILLLADTLALNEPQRRIAGGSRGHPYRVPVNKKHTFSGPKSFTASKTAAAVRFRSVVCGFAA